MNAAAGALVMAMLVGACVPNDAPDTALRREDADASSTSIGLPVEPLAADATPQSPDRVEFHGVSVAVPDEWPVFTDVNCVTTTGVYIGLGNAAGSCAPPSGPGPTRTIFIQCMTTGAMQPGPPPSTTVTSVGGAQARYGEPPAWAEPVVFIEQRNVTMSFRRVPPATRQVVLDSIRIEGGDGDGVLLDGCS